MEKELIYNLTDVVNDDFKPVEYIANNKIVEGLVHDYMVESDFADDLIQETYMILLDYNQTKLQQLIDKGHIRFYVARIVRNQYFSNTSNFYRKYKRPLLLKESLRPILDNEEGKEESED